VDDSDNKTIYEIRHAGVDFNQMKPMEVFDGAIFNVTTGQWKQLCQNFDCH
jgi:hypothetical protein